MTRVSSAVRRGSRLLRAPVACALLAVHALGAQAPSATTPPDTAAAAGARRIAATGSVSSGADSVRTVRPHLLLPNEVRALGTFALAAAAATPFDLGIAHVAARPALHRDSALLGTMDAFRLLGDPGTLVLTGGAYLAGRLARRPRLADVGLHAGEAVVASGLASALLKLAVGRARPYATGDRDADALRPGRGLGAYTSFPSGHTTVAFAAAAAAAAELTRPDLAAAHPAAARVGPPLLYTAATLAGISRVYHDKHWASDVLAGAGLGFVAGRAVVRFLHGRPPDHLQRLLLSLTVAPTPWGTAVGWRGAYQ